MLAVLWQGMLMPRHAACHTCLGVGKDWGRARLHWSDFMACTLRLGKKGSYAQR